MITHPDVITTLSPEDLQRWRTWWARDDAIHVAPSQYNRAELEEHFRQRLVLRAEFVERYDVLDSPFLSISPVFGGLFYSEEAQNDV